MNNHKNIKILFFLVFLLSAPAQSTAATLLDVDWSTGSVCNGTNLNDGVLTGGTNDDCGLFFDLGTGGPADRNYLSLLFDSTDGSSVLYNPSSFSNPSTVYVRFWFRVLQFVGGDMHTIWLNNEVGSYGFCLFRGYTTGDFSILSNDSAAVYYYSPANIELNTWYRLEFKITGGGGSSGTVEMRLDGTTITDSMVREDGGGATMSDDAGSIAVPSINYFYISMYGPNYGAYSQFIDIAGVKITDGPDWIGGDDAPIPARKLNNVSGVRVTLH